MTTNLTKIQNDPIAQVIATEEEISALAYQLWEAEGKPDGMSEQHWFRASEMIAEQAKREAPIWLQRSAPIELTQAEKEQAERQSELAATVEEIKRKIAGRAA